MAIWLKETFVDETKGHPFGSGDWYESWTDDQGKLFRSLQKEYGRCDSAMYQDRADGTVKIGWVFGKRMRYEDARGNDPERDFYLRKVWVQISIVEPVKKWVWASRPVSPWEEKHV